VPRLSRLAASTGLAAALTITPFLPSALHAADADDSLAATTAVPWNPPGAMASRRPWEQVVNFPGRVVSLPFEAVGAATQRTLTWVEDHELIRLRPITAPGEPVRHTRILTFNAPHLGDRAGIGAGFILRTPTRDDRIPTASLRYAATFNRYNSTQVAFSRGPFALAYGYDWRPQMQFFGIGRHTSDAVTTDYAFQQEYVRAMATFARRDSSERNSPPAELRLWAGPRSAVTSRGREPGRASYEALFPELGAATLGVREDHFVWGGGITLDNRRGAPHWSHGGRLRVDAERMSPPIQALALRSADTDVATATRVIAEAEGGFSFRRDPRTLRFRVRVSDLTIDRHPERFLFADLSRLGGHEGLAGFTPGRFMDRDALLTRAMYVFPLSRLFEADVHGEWGAVYHDVWREASFASLEHSFGFAFRGRTAQSPHGSIGLDFSRDGFRINYAWGGVE
jgi:hypothetical protein